MGYDIIPPPLEDDEAKTFVEMMEWRNLKHFHIPNENSIRSPQYLKKMKAMGWNKGIADYFVIIPYARSKDGTPRGLFIEIKRQGAKNAKTGKVLKSPSKVYPEQAEFISDVAMIPGIESTIAYGADEAISFVDSFIK